MLLVTTINPEWRSNSRATASVVVPMARNSEAPSWDFRGASPCDGALFLGVQGAPILIADVHRARPQDRPAVHALQLARLVEIGQIAADGLGGDAKAGGQIIDHDPPLGARDLQDVGQTKALGHDSHSILGDCVRRARCWQDPARALLRALEHLAHKR